MLLEISISINMQKSRNGAGRSIDLWPKNAHADSLGVTEESLRSVLEFVIKIRFLLNVK